MKTSKKQVTEEDPTNFQIGQLRPGGQSQTAGPGEALELLGEHNTMSHDILNFHQAHAHFAQKDLEDLSNKL